MIWPCVFIIMIPRSGANDATRATNKLYALQKSCDCPINHRHLEAKGWRTDLFTSLAAPIYFLFLFARRVTLGSAATTAGSLCLELSSQPSDYSYFNSDFMSTWAGPQHWRLRSKFSKGTLIRIPTVANPSVWYIEVQRWSNRIWIRFYLRLKVMLHWTIRNEDF